MNRGLKVLLGFLLLVSLLLDVMPSGLLIDVSARAASVDVERRPVIIVAEPSFGGASAEGDPRQGTGEAAGQIAGRSVSLSAGRGVSLSAGQGVGQPAPSAFARTLASVGYVPGKNLFEIGICGLRDLPDGALQLALAVRSAMRSAVGSGAGAGAEGCPQSCDIIASGLSGFIARYALEKGYLDAAEVANLVMVSSPNRGTFLADVVKSVLEVVRQESLLEKETRAERFLPSVRDLLGVPADAADGSIKSLTQARALAAPEWDDEASWVSRRSAALWEPLYAAYVKERHFALPYLPSESPKETFAGWIRRTLPEVWRRVITEAAWPNLRRQDLSLPYYEYLSMEVARNQYAMRMAASGSLVKSLFDEPYLPTGWKEAAVHYGLKILRHYAKKALVTLKAEVQELVADQAVRFTGLGSGPDSPLISELIKEDLLINLGTSSSKRFERIPANLGLEALNKSSQASARRRETRYVSVCSRLANPWGLIWPQLAPNDCLLEVDSSVPPVGTGDLVAVFSGFLRLPGRSLLDDKRAQAYIESVLRDYAALPKDSSDNANAPQGSLLVLEASSWEPRRCSIGSAHEVTVGVTALPAGWQCQVWEEPSEPEPVRRRNPGLMWAFDSGGNYVVRVSPGTSRLGFRLFRSGPANPVSGSAVGSAYAGETLVRVFLALHEDEAPEPLHPPDADPAPDPTEQADPADPSDSEDPGRPAPVEEGNTGGIGTGNVDGSSDESGGGIVNDGGGQFDGDSAGDADDLPTVRVVYRSKHTTLKKPKETVHGYWLADFGDGVKDRIEGSPSLVVDHAYATPGKYGAQAESYTGDGKFLYAKKWDVSVALSGETRRFTCQSVAPLAVDVVLNGPKKWVTGKRAVFSAGLNVELPPNAEIISVKYDPGEVFGVIWERAGDLVVGCAASIIVKYSLEDASIEVENIYIREVPVTVLTTGVTQ